MTNIETFDSLVTMRAFIEIHLSADTLEQFEIAYAPSGKLPAAVKINDDEHHYRLERDAETRTWYLASDEAEPRLLAYYLEDGSDFEDWLLAQLSSRKEV